MAGAKDRGRGEPARGRRATPSSGGSSASSRSSSSRSTSGRGTGGTSAKKSSPRKPPAKGSTGRSSSAKGSSASRSTPRKPAAKKSSGQGSAKQTGTRPSGQRATPARSTSGRSGAATGRSGRAARTSGARKPAARGAGRKVTTNGLVAPGTTPRPRPKPTTRTAPRPRPKRPTARELRRRRALRNGTLAVLLSIGLLVGLGTAGGYGIGRAADVVRDLWPEPGPHLSADKATPPEPLDLSGPAETCLPNAAVLEVTPDAGTLTAGDVLSFTMRVTNGGRMPCLVDGRGSSMQLVVTDAEGERVWSSADCGSTGGADLLLGVGEYWDRTVRWSGSSSQPGCEGKRERLAAGDYTATMSLADVPDAVGEPVTITVAEPPADTSEKSAEGDADEKAEGETDEKAQDDADEKDPPAQDRETKD